MTRAEAAVRLERPDGCRGEALREFASMVVEGFDSDRATLDGRVRAARWLAFHEVDGELAGIAALKSPDAEHRRRIFERAASPVGSGEVELDLGWIYVRPQHRRRGIAAGLCRELLERVPGEAVFATTRPDNRPMIRILLALGFERVGRPFPRRDETLALFLRPGARRREGGEAS